MIKLIFGPKVKLELATDSEIYYLGSPVNANVNIYTNKDLKMEEVRMELHCKVKITYDVEESRYNSSEKRYETYWTTETRTFDVVNFVQRVIEKGVIKPPGVSFQWNTIIPQEAPPSHTGRHINTTWTLKVVINRHLRPDIKKEQTLQIYWHAADPSYLTPVEQPMNFGSVTAILKLPKSVYKFGETVQGTLYLVGIKDEKFNEIRATLLHYEQVRPASFVSSNVTDFRGDFVNKVVTEKIANDVKLQPNQGIEIPVALRIPMIQQPSIQFQYYTSAWTLKITLSRRLKKDYNVELPIIVTNSY